VENPRASITTQSLAQLTELKALAKSSVDEFSEMFRPVRKLV
jgi:hypothetical protein